MKLGQKTGSRTAPLVKEWADIVLFINYKTFSIATDDKEKTQSTRRYKNYVYHASSCMGRKNRHGLPDELPLDYSRIAHIFIQPTSAEVLHQTPAMQTQPAPAAHSDRHNNRQRQQRYLSRLRRRRNSATRSADRPNATARTESQYPAISL